LHLWKIILCIIMSLEIGQRVGNKIYAGPDYGLQSPASFKQLQDKGAFKLGAQTIRRAGSIAAKLYDRHAPQALKDGVKWLGNSEERTQQRLRDRGFTQKQIDEQHSWHDFKSSEDATTKLLRNVSDATNIAPEIVNAGAFLLETAAEGISGRAMARSSLRGLSRAPAPKAFANLEVPKNGPKLVPQGNPQRALPLQQPQPDLPEARFPGGSAAALKRDTEVRSGISQKVRDIQSGKAVPHSSSVNKATDKLATEKAAASAKATQNKGPKNTNPTTSNLPDSLIPGSPATPQVTKSTLQDLAKDKRERNQLRDRAQRKALERFNNSGGTHPTFTSKKGKDVNSFSAGVDDASWDYAQGSKAVKDGGIQFEDGERVGSKGGQRGALPPVKTSLQLQAIGKKLGVPNYQTLSPAQRKQVLVSHLRQQGVKVDKLNSSQLRKELRRVTAELSVTDEALRADVRKLTTERRFPEQFNQLEARDRQGVELPSRDRGTRMNNPREQALGKGIKPREGNKLPKNLSVKERIAQRTQINETNRSDNIPGGRRIKQSKATSKQRIAAARQRARAATMTTVPAKTGSTQSGWGTLVDRARQARKQGSQSKLPQPSNSRQFTPDADEIREFYPRQDEQFLDAPEPDGFRRASGKQRQEFNQLDEVESAARGQASLDASKQRAKGWVGTSKTTTGNRGTNRKNSSIERRLQESKRKEANKQDVEPRTNKGDTKSTAVGTTSQHRNGGKSSPSKSTSKPGSRASRTPLPERARRTKAERQQAREDKKNFQQLQRDFNRQITSQREVSPQDGLVNPNPFNAQGELRSATIVSRRGQPIGVNGVKVEDYGASPQNPAGAGRSANQTPAAIKRQIQALTKKANQVDANGKPTEEALKALKKLNELQPDMKPIRQRTYERAARQKADTNRRDDIDRVNQARVRAGNLKDKLNQPPALRSRSSRIQERLKRVKELRDKL
jgi:hypothetical protein